jgi:hypothetical protein
MSKDETSFPVRNIPEFPATEKNEAYRGPYCHARIMDKPCYDNNGF